MTFSMASRSRCAFLAGGDNGSVPVNGFTESESDVTTHSVRAFLIGVAGGTASGKVIFIPSSVTS